MYKRKIPIELNCGLDLVREVLYGKWKIHLIYFISQGIKRPGELQRKIPGATRRVLNVQLNQLEEHELISKRIYAELPPRVEYSLTEFGQTTVVGFATVIPIRLRSCTHGIAVQFSYLGNAPRVLLTPPLPA